MLLLTASMGGGHLQVSRELGRRLAARGHEVAEADLLELMSRPAGAALRWFYPWMVNHAPWLYDRIYQHFFLAQQRAAERAGVPVKLSLGGLRRLCDRIRPHAVVSTYHLAGVAAARLRGQGELSAPAVTFITTFGVHDLWLHPATDRYISITEEVAELVAARTGRPVSVCEPVVRPNFTPRAAARAVSVRSQLGARDGERVALLVTGSLGLGRAADAVSTLADAAGWRPVAVCGRNTRLLDRLRTVPGVTALGWIDDMAPLVAAADVVVDNAGGSSAKESLAVGVPVVTYRPIAGHGRDDANTMAALGLTDVVDEPHQLLAALDRLCDPPVRAARVAAGRRLFGRDPVRCIEEAMGVADAAQQRPRPLRQPAAGPSAAVG